MIELLYKIIHYEPSPEYKDNVMRSFHFIWALLSTLPAGLIYLIYKKMSKKNQTTEFAFLASEILVIGLIYYIIVTRKSKVYIETDLGRHYFRLGRFTNLLKPLIPLTLFGVIIIIGRIMVIVLN